MEDESIIYYNKEKYTQELTLYRLKSNYANSSFPSDTLILFNDNIKSFKYNNDLLTGIPQMTVVFEDVGNQAIANIRPDGYTYLSLNLKYKNNGQTTDLYHTFILEDVDVLNKKSDSIVYEMTFSSMCSISLKLPVMYSSTTEKDITVIVKELLKAANYPIDDIKFKMVTPSGLKINYITPVNAQLCDCLEDVLSYACEPKTGIYYVWHSLINNKAELLSINDVFNTLDVGEYNYLNIPTKDNFEDLERSLTNLISINYIKGSDNFIMNMPIEFNKFDLKTRKWEKDPFPYKKFKDIVYKLPGNSIGTYDKLFKQIPKIVYNSDKLTYSYEPLNRSKLRDKIHNLTMFSDVIQFKCMGHLARDIGELIIIDSGNEELSKRYGGLWLIVRISHEYSGSQYYNNIIAVRSDEYVGLSGPAGIPSSAVPVE